VQHGHHEFVRGLDAVADLGQRRRLSGLAELADVGAADEGLALADDQHGAHRGVRIGLVQGRDQALSHSHPQGVDGRVVDAHHLHRAAARDVDDRSGMGLRHAGISG